MWVTAIFTQKVKKVRDNYLISTGLVEIEYEQDNDATIKYATVKYVNIGKDELAETQIDTEGKVLARYATVYITDKQGLSKTDC